MAAWEAPRAAAAQAPHAGRLWQLPRASRLRGALPAAGGSHSPTGGGRPAAGGGTRAVDPHCVHVAQAEVEAEVGEGARQVHLHGHVNRKPSVSMA